MSSPRAAPSAVHLEEPARTPYVTTVLADAEGPAVAVSDWTKAVPGQIARWVARPVHLARHRRVGLLRHRAGCPPVLPHGRRVDRARGAVGAGPGRQDPAAPPAQATARYKLDLPVSEALS
jgi:hypothetical protein